MTEERSDDLTPEEREAFGSLSSAELPGPECEDQVVASLRERGLIRRESWLSRVFGGIPRVPRLAVGAAALAVSFGLGMEFGKQSGEVETPEALLETEAEEEAVGEAGGEMMAALDPEDGSVSWSYDGGGKPALNIEGEEGYGEFPPYPLDGNPRSFSPKYR